MNSSFFGQIVETDLEADLQSSSHVSGGCINNTEKIVTSKGTFFIKRNNDMYEDMFLKEALGLAYLESHSALRVPKVVSQGTAGNQAYLLLEWIESGHRTHEFWSSFGKYLAQQHNQTSKWFGLDHDNYIGRLPQTNKKHSSWYDFFITERLEPQIKLALQNYLLDEALVEQFKKFYKKLEELIPIEPPSLLHGDLWSGNFMVDINNSPVLVDPAFYYGHRETELAFTHLFGGFEPTFYRFYEEEHPLEPGFDRRIAIHNLYPLLVHVNLFGSSYLSGIKQTLKRFV